MKYNSNFEHTHGVCRGYEAPAMEVVEVVIERGFEVSSDGFEGPSYEEEDVVW